MKATSTIWPLAIILAGGLIIRKQQQVKGCKGVGAISRKELWKRTNAYMNANVQPCDKTVYAYLPSLNKNNTINEYLREGKRYDTGEYDSWYKFQHKKYMDFSEKVVCSQCVNFTSKQQKLYDFLCNSLLVDYDIFSGHGGNQTDDKRIEQYDALYQVPREIMETIEWYLVDCILISYNGVPQFIVDPEGRGYASYIGFLPTFSNLQLDIDFYQYEE